MLVSGCKLLEGFDIRTFVPSGLWSKGEIEGFSQLVTADVPIQFVPLKALYNVKFLHLDARIPCYDIPMFHNLTHLEFLCLSNDSDWLMKLLQNCPKLQILVIHETLNHYPLPCRRKDEMLMEPVPECISSQLKKFYLGGYNGSEGILKLASLIMKNARVLKTITISSTSSSNGDAKLQMIKRLSSCPRGSASCRLLFD